MFQVAAMVMGSRVLANYVPTDASLVGRSHGDVCDSNQWVGLGALISEAYPREFVGRHGAWYSIWDRQRVALGRLP
jgi:hypothetical protein